MENKPKWISCYIFHNTSFEKVLIEFIKPFIKNLKESKLINQYFFIRYWENGPHLRLRVLPSNHEFKNKLITTIKLSTKNYFESQKKGLKYSLELNDYIQEVQRYGGSDTIKITEKHFQDSSNTVLTLIANDFVGWSYSSAISNAIQMHLIFAKKMINNLNDTISYFDLLVKKMLINSVKLNDNNNVTKAEIIKLNNFFINSYNDQKETINYITKVIWSEQSDNHWIKIWSDDCNELSYLIKQAHNSNKILKPEWINIDEKSIIDKEKQILWSIYDSYIHMTNNRLGIHMRDEAFIAFLILNGLKSL